MTNQSESEQYYNAWYFTRYPNYSAYEQLTDQQKRLMHKGLGFMAWKLVNSILAFQGRFWASIGKLLSSR